MKRTFEEKVKYNETNSRKSYFSSGYSWAVFLYQKYIHSSSEVKTAIKAQFDSARENIKLGQEELRQCEIDFAEHKSKMLYDIQKCNAQFTIDYHKGMMCGLRDAANKRKARKN